MSEENVEIVRRAYEAWASSDFETLFGLVDERGLIHRVPPLGGGTYHGHEGLIETSTEWSEDFAEWEMRAEELFDLGDQVLVRVYQRAVGAGSGVPVESRYWFLHWLRDGKITRLHICSTEAAARKAVGLSEDDAHSSYS
jgi:ketosteroid isomerase-like protein